MSDTQPVAVVAKYVLEDNGDVILNQKNGKRVVLANFNEDTSHLVFENKEASIKFRAQILQVIGTTGDGTVTSGRIVKSMGIKGESLDDTQNIPPRPRMNKNLGDSTPEVVEWYFKYKPKEAYVRYGVRLDAKGNPVRGNVQRKSIETIDQRDLDDSQIEAQRDGTHSESKGCVVRSGTIERRDNQIIASRATHMTFLKEEVIGYDGGEDDEFDGMEERDAQ